ncbi:MAG: bifunctional metallophosphatase/5'-nucleotidase [Desulfobacteraceae bacterium]|nr:MAG: bifunctional metallophosphatase/5'-nucleotidase [Desulfobacteraceae bacterium]
MNLSPERPVRPIHACLAALLLLIWMSSTGWAASAGLTILHTNDTHGHLQPFSYPDTALDTADLEQRGNIGGIARRAALAGRIRAEQQARDVPVWLVDAGDFSDGTPFSTEYRGEADIAAMNAAGYDFAVLGNHEFNHSLAQVKRLLSLARYPVLCANAVQKADGKPLAPAYVLRTIGPLKIALFGLLTREARAYPAARKALDILDEVDTARRMAIELRPQADIIIAVSHCGDEVDQRIAETVDDIDVIIGGHSHSRLPAGKFVWHSEELKAHDVNGTILVQNHQWGGELGRLDLLFVQDEQGAWHVERYRARLLPVTAAIPEDESVAAVVADFWRPIAGRYGAVIGRAAGDFVTLHHDRAEYNLMADAIREAFNTDVALENIGGVRAPLVKGPIMLADLVAMDPFDNTIVTFQIKGAQLKQLLREERPAVSGLRYRVEAGRLLEATCAGEPVSDAKVYTGATNSFYAGILPKECVVHDTGRKRLQVLMDHIRQKGSVAPAYDGRRIIVAGRP